MPDKPKYKGVCNPCGQTYNRLRGQIDDTVAIIERAKSAVTCYDRCMFGMGLITEFRSFVDNGVGSYPGGRSLAEMSRYFLEKAEAFADVIRGQNEKRVFDKKVGLPHFSHWKRLYKLASAEPGACKGCWTHPAENGAGFCRACLLMGTTANQSEMDAFVASGDAEGIVGDELPMALLNWKLDKSKGG